MKIILIVPSIPVAQPRQRHRIAGAAGKHFVQNYTPADAPVNSFKAVCRMALQREYSGPPLEGPVAMSIVAIFPRPGRLIWKKRPMPREPHISRPDVDNCFKAVADALTGLAYRDDAQVSSMSFTKWIASGKEAPHVEITVEDCQSLVKSDGDEACQDKGGDGAMNQQRLW